MHTRPRRCMIACHDSISMTQQDNALRFRYSVLKRHSKNGLRRPRHNPRDTKHSTKQKKTDPKGRKDSTLGGRGDTLVP